MRLNIHNGRIDSAVWTPTENKDERPAAGYVNSMVIHAISLPPDQFGGQFVEDFFCNRLDTTLHPYFASIEHLRVSAHFYITRNARLVQFVATSERAWHAGESSFNGLDKVNDYSIGVELEGCDNQSFTDQQYCCLANLSACLMNGYPAITKKRIVGHSDIAPGRKTDPGPLFEWHRFLNAL